MPNLDLKKIKSARNPKTVLKFGLIALAVLALLLPTALYNHGHTTLQVNGHSLSLEVARTVAAQEKGLGDRSSLPANHGMLFVFAQPKKVCLWMKDMRFSLDMVWLNANKKVVFIERNISPATYPAAFCTKENATYVVELGAGQAAKLGIHNGRTLTF